MKSSYQALIIGKKLENAGYGQAVETPTRVYLRQDSGEVRLTLYPSVYIENGTRADYEELYSNLMRLRKTRDYEDDSYYRTLADMLNQTSNRIFSILGEQRKDKKTMEKSDAYKQYENKLIDELFYYGWVDVELAPLAIKCRNDEDEITELERLYGDLCDIQFGAETNGECELYQIVIATALRDLVHTLANKARR